MKRPSLERRILNHQNRPKYQPLRRPDLSKALRLHASEQHRLPQTLLDLQQKDIDSAQEPSSDLSTHSYKTALILGTGRSGRAAEALLREEGCSVVCLCEETTPDYTFEKIQFHPDVVIMSPGFPLTHPWVHDLLLRGIPLLSEIELGWSRRRCPVIAVTGSNGKSTVVKWIVEALLQAGVQAVPCGNYGFPVCNAVRLLNVPDWLVMEVSSFQLETVQEFRPDIGVLLNILPNHLDRHQSLETYRNLKFRLFEKMTSNDTAMVPTALFPAIEKKSSNAWKTFGTEIGSNVRYIDGHVGSINLRGTLFANEVLRPAAAAVAGVCEICGIEPAAVETSARTFEPLPHRMQFVTKIGGVNFIDDSKATNLAALCAALKSSSGNVHLIAGGRSKEHDLTFAKDLLVQRVKRLYLIGEATSMMRAAWEDSVKCLSCKTLERAVTAAMTYARSGETVLLSPACASFDQFRSFGERGDCFVSAVQAFSTGSAKKNE